MMRMFTVPAGHLIFFPGVSRQHPRAGCGKRRCHHPYRAQNLYTQWHGAGDVTALHPQPYPELTGKPAARSAAVENPSHVCISINTVWM